MTIPFFKSKRIYPHDCGDCIHFDECKKVTVKYVRYDTDSCQWERDKFEPKEKK